MARRRPTRRRSTRRYGPSTRAGQRRKTARRAYRPKRRSNPRRKAPVRRRRRNPRPMILGTPAFTYGISAVGGAVAAAWLNNAAAEGIAAHDAGSTSGRGWAAAFTPELGANGRRLHAGVLGAAATWGLALFLPKLKARTRNTLVAAGAGMLTQPAIEAVANIGRDTSAVLAPPAKTGGAMHRISAPRQTGYNSAVHYNNAAAAFSGVKR
jgi:hypothetical protein